MAVDIIARGLASRADSKAITAYEYAKQAGYTGTEQEFAEDMGNSAENATKARESAEQAQEYAEQAEQTLENKADIDGYYGGMGVGIADNLNANEKIHLTKPYVLRSTAESEDVAGLYKRTHLTGGSLVWNQLVQNGNFANALNWYANRGTIAVANNKCTFTLGSDVSTTSSLYQPLTGKFFSDHVYYVTATLTSSANTTAQLRLFGSGGYVEALTANNRKQISIIMKCNGNDSNVYVYVNVGGALVENDSVILENIMCLDITTTFGTTFANAIYSMNDHGVAWFYANFPELNGGYIPYSAPHFEHSKYKGVTGNGVNQLPAGFVIGKQWVEGVVINAGDTNAVTIDKYKCLPNTTYAITLPHVNRTNVYVYAKFFEINGNYISFERKTLESDNHMVFTTPANCYLFTFQVYRSSGVAFTESELADPCVVIHYDTSYDGISEPYESWHNDLGSDVLKGIPVADDWTGTGTWSGKWHWEGDTKTPDGTITEKYALVDLGTLNWMARGNGVFTLGSERIYVTESTVLCTNYTYTTSAVTQMPDKSIATFSYYNAHDLVIKDSAFANATATEFKTAMSGVMAVVQLETPTTSQGTAYEENEQCHNWGIQYVEDAEYDDGNRAFKMPMGGEEVYTPNLTEKVEGMPSAPVNDGDYIVRVVNHKAEYIPLPNSFPEVPTSADGRYDLVANVSSGTVTLSWVARS